MRQQCMQYIIKLLSNGVFLFICAVSIMFLIGFYSSDNELLEGHLHNTSHISSKTNIKSQTNPQPISISKYFSRPKSLRIVLSFATGIHPSRIYLFLASFRDFHPFHETLKNSALNISNEEMNNKENYGRFHKQYELYLFTKFDDNEKSRLYLPEYQQMAEYFNIHLVDMTPIETALDKKYYALFQRSMKYIRINKRRFFILWFWIQSYINSENIDAIFLSDANDVKFQGNIFSLMDETFLKNPYSLSVTNDEIFWFFMELPDVTMANEKWNRRYIKYCFGNESIAKYEGLQVSCSGTSLATYDAMYYYLQMMNEILVKQGPMFEECLSKPGDQALHNIILHESHLETRFDVKTIRVPNDSGWVLQITTMINHPVYKYKVPEMANEAMVVHQWKWAKSLVNAYEQEYNYQVFCEQQNWKCKLF